MEVILQMITLITTSSGSRAPSRSTLLLSFIITSFILTSFIIPSFITITRKECTLIIIKENDDKANDENENDREKEIKPLLKKKMIDDKETLIMWESGTREGMTWHGSRTSGPPWTRGASRTLKLWLMILDGVFFYYYHHSYYYSYHLFLPFSSLLFLHFPSLTFSYHLLSFFLSYLPSLLIILIIRYCEWHAERFSIEVRHCCRGCAVSFLK